MLDIYLIDWAAFNFNQNILTQVTHIDGFKIVVFSAQSDLNAELDDIAQQIAHIWTSNNRDRQNFESSFANWRFPDTDSAYGC